MSHYYIMGPNGPQRFRPIKKDGAEYQNIPAKLVAGAGAVDGLTSILSEYGGVGGLMYWSSKIGVQVGIRHGMREALKLGAAVCYENEADLENATVERLTPDAMKAWLKEKDSAADAGTAIHDAIENFLGKGIVPENPIHQTAAHACWDWLASQGVDPSEGKAEVCCLYKGIINGVLCQFGGTTDFISDGLIVDWKSISDNRQRKPKESECAQLAGYRKAFDKPNARCVNIYIGRESGKILSVKEWTNAELKAGLDVIAQLFKIRSLYAQIGGKS